MFSQSKILNKIRALNRERVQSRRVGRVTPNNNRAPRRQRIPYRAPNHSNAATRPPLVSVIIVGFNGARHLPDVLLSVANQTYRNHETIYVDNASTDASCDIVTDLMPQAKIVRSSINTGFAEGNNIGVDHAEGEFLLLLNNDARLEPDALERMVDALRADENLGAIAPKIRFWERFVECELRSTHTPLHEFKISITESNTGYRKIIENRKNSNISRTILIPESAQKLVVSHNENDEASDSEKSPPKIAISNKVISWDEPLPSLSGQWVLNNAGSWISKTGDAGDWGFGEFDLGQYDTPALVDAFCGCCALIRRPALGLHPLFPPSFFAYYEDTDASERLIASGFNILYLPTAIAYHKHASTSVENSPFFKYFVRRNQAAFQATHFQISDNRQILTRFKNWGVDGSGPLRSADIIGPNPYSNDLGLTEDTLRLTAQAGNRAIYLRRPPRKRIGIFNEFWESKGGGELRALHVAKQLASYGDVFLISRRYFEISDLSQHFGIESDNLKLAVIPTFSDEDTAQLDIFINTAFCSKIHSRAKKSAYLVSFPHTGGHISVMHSYDVVLANSLFTEKWCHHMWPGSSIELLYPSVDQPESVEVEHKKRTIVSVGRFFDSGHNKKQLEMIEAFSKLAKNPHMSDWRLILIGGCNLGNPSDVAYLNRVKQKAAGLPIEIAVNTSADAIQMALRDASIYWHATGVGLTDFEPMRFEHFGMAIVEAMSHGLIPVVHDRGGAPEIVENGKSGYHFSSLDDLIDLTLGLARLRDKNPQDFFKMARSAHIRAKAFSPEAHKQQLETISISHLGCNERTGR